MLPNSSKVFTFRTWPFGLFEVWSLSKTWAFQGECSPWILDFNCECPIQFPNASNARLHPIATRTDPIPLLQINDALSASCRPENGLLSFLLLLVLFAFSDGRDILLRLQPKPYLVFCAKSQIPKQCQCRYAFESMWREGNVIFVWKWRWDDVLSLLDINGRKNLDMFMSDLVYF